MNKSCDIVELKKQQNPIFGNNYKYLIERLADYYISKIDGKNRIIAELMRWDDESRQIILNDLANNLQLNVFELKLELDEM